MAIVTKAGFVETAKLMIGETATAWASMAVGTGAQAEADTLTTLGTECVDNQLTRVSAATVDLQSSATASDTCRFVHTWTCSVAAGTIDVDECGVFNSSSGGDMLCYGTFGAAIPLGSGDTLKVTWSVQVKAGA